MLRTRVDVVVRPCCTSRMPSPSLNVLTLVCFLVQGSISLPPTRFNSTTRKLGLQGPIAVDLRDVTITAIL